MSSLVQHEMNTLINLSCLGLLKVEGDGAHKLLQGQLSCNLDEIVAGESRLGAHCNPQGRIISFFRIFYYQHAFYLQVPAEMLAAAQTALQKYAVFFKVNITDASAKYGRLSFSGLSSTEQLKVLISTLPTKIDEETEYEEFFIIKLPGLTPHYEIVGDTNSIAELSEKLKTNQSTHTGTLNDWKYLCISAGIPTVYPQTEIKLLPHEINLQLINAVNFNKGCYTGQEIIARMHYRGQLKKHLYYASVISKSLPEPGTNIYDDESCGIVVDSCHYSEDTYHLLVVAAEADVQTKSIFIDAEKKQLLKFLALPYP